MAAPPNQQPADLTGSGSIAALGTGALPVSVTASGTGVVVLASKTGRSNWIAQLSALPAGMTLNFAASFDGGATYHAISGTQLGGTGVLVSSTTSANNVAGESNSQVWIGLAAGVTHLAVWCSVYTSGSVTVTWVASAATRHVVLNNGLPPSTNSIGSVTANAGTNLNTSTLALEAGGHLANVDTHATSLDTKTPALGQALAASSVPVVLPAAQITTITPPAAITGFALEAGHLATIDGKLPATIGGGLPVNVVAGGGGGGAMTVADGADVTLGAKADAAITNPGTSGTIMAVLRGVLTAVNNLLPKGSATSANSSPVVIASDQASIAAKSGHIELAGLSSTGTGTPLVASQDCLGYRAVCIQLLGTFVGTVTFQQSNDNANWSNLPLILVNSVGASAPVNTASTTGHWVGPIACRYVRFTVTSYASGTIQGVVEIDAVPPPVQSSMVLAAISGSWTAATAPVKVAGSSFSGQTITPSIDANFGAATKNASKGSAGQVFAAIFTNANAAVRYAQLHNKATAPAGADVPIYSIPIPAGTANAPGILILGENVFGQGGKQFATGVGWAISTTVATFTDSATAADHTVHVHYI